MVVFTCNYCGDAVQKRKADEHISIKCKKKKYEDGSLCCVDCIQDFDFYTYRTHAKCITEKDSALGFIAKPSSCKGGKKQSSWVDTISTLLKKWTLTSQHKSVLQSISSFQNVPRKKAKFMNFMTNAGYRNSEYNLLETVFNLIESEFKSSNSFTRTKAKSPVKKKKSSVNAAQDFENTDDDLVGMNVQNSNNDVSFQNDNRVIAKSRGKKKPKQIDATSTEEIVANDVDVSSEVLISENPSPTSSVEENFAEKPEKKKKKRKLNRADTKDQVDSKRSHK